MTGIIAKKLGMTQIFNDQGESIPVTIVEAQPNIIVHHKTKDKDGYNACVLGAGVKKNPNRPYRGVFKKLQTMGFENVKPSLVLCEIRNPPSDWAPGKSVTVSIFSEGSTVSVIGYSKGRGFTGVVKRHGFSGGPKSHGSKFHARPGSIGLSKTPARVFKGHPLPGRMGCQKVTLKNVKVVKVEVSQNLLFLKGQIPGSVKGWVTILVRGLTALGRKET